MRYALYLRRSSDESSGKQSQSIPDQKKHCLELAQRLNLKIDKKDIIEESKSARRSHCRPKYRKLIELVNEGYYKGILAWHPDRLSRNALEGGEIIDLLDQGILKDVQFCTMTFDNSASGKMLLSMMFVLAKQYTDSLSESISRGVDSSLEQGRSSGTPKWGYSRSDEGYYVPDENFSLIKEAFILRSKGSILEDIHTHLIKSGCQRTTKGKKKVRSITLTGLSRLFEDPFYIGLLTQAGKTIPLKEMYDFKPLIDKETYDQVQAISRGGKTTNTTKTNYPFRGDIVTCLCKSYCRPEKSKGRRGDYYLYLVCKNKECPYKTRQRSKLLINAINTKFEELATPSKTRYEEYKKALKKAVAEEVAINRESISSLNKQTEQISQKLDKLVINALEKSLDSTEQRVYNNKKALLESKLNSLTDSLFEAKQEISALSLDYDEFSNLLQNGSEYWQTADHEEKHQLAQIFFSNLVLKGKEVASVELKPSIKKVFFPNGGDAGIRTRV